MYDTFISVITANTESEVVTQVYNSMNLVISHLKMSEFINSYPHTIPL